MAEGADDVKFEMNTYKELTMESLLEGYRQNDLRKNRKHAENLKEKWKSEDLREEIKD